MTYRFYIVVIAVLLVFNNLAFDALANELYPSDTIRHLAEMLKDDYKFSPPVTDDSRTVRDAIDLANDWGRMVISEEVYSGMIPTQLYRDMFAPMEGASKSTDVIVSTFHVNTGVITTLQTSSIVLMRFKPLPDQRIDLSQPLEAFKKLLPEKLRVSTYRGTVEVPDFSLYMRESIKAVPVSEVSGLYIFRTTSDPFFLRQDSSPTEKSAGAWKVPTIKLLDRFAWYRKLRGWCTDSEVIVYFPKCRPESGRVPDLSGRYDNDWF